MFSAFVAALLAFSATISMLSILSTGVMVSALEPFIDSSLECALLCVSFEAPSTLWPDFKAVRKFSFAHFLSFAFCNAFSLLCFNNHFLSIFIVYIFVVLPFLIFQSVSVSLSLASSLIFSICLCVFVCLTGDSVRSILSGVLSRLSLLSMIPSTCGIKLLLLSIIS